MKFCIFSVIIFGLIQSNYCIFKENFKEDYQTTYDEKLKFSLFNQNVFKQALIEGIKSYARRTRLEVNFVDNEITIKNGSVSHSQYIDSFPNDDTKSISKTATKIMHANQYILNYKCMAKQIWYASCNNLMSKIKIPPSNLLNECTKIIQNPEYRIFRRLLSANYSDSLYRMYNYQTEPRKLSNFRTKIDHYNYGDAFKDDTKNLVLVQWSQFIEHDLSKPVVSTMDDGTPITCCKNSYKIAPRNNHQNCIPLLEIRNDNYSKNCLSYVRSALGVNYNCNFGAGEIINQASGILDLSQLYGYTEQMSISMREADGKLKASSGESDDMPFLPFADERGKYCSTKWNNLHGCFMAGDTRVNSNPLSITLYTIFLRLHNQFATKLAQQNKDWSFEKIYQTARKLNIKIYRSIIFNDWLPIIVGQKMSYIINNETFYKIKSKADYEISNEFAVAASRFYYSMMPNSIYSNANDVQKKIFDFKDNYYKSDLFSNLSIINTLMEGMFKQKAMKMDSYYANSVLKHFMRTTSSGSDVLAFDIQRSRDHGLQGYIKYLERCENIKIKSWNDLIAYIGIDNMHLLQSVYRDINDIDLIIGGLMEYVRRDTTVGTTFSCIIAEQFSSIRQLQHYLEKDDMENNLLDDGTRNLSGQVLCRTTSLTAMPKNIFLIPSESNPMITCDEIKKNKIMPI